MHLLQRLPTRRFSPVLTFCACTSQRDDSNLVVVSGVGVSLEVHPMTQQHRNTTKVSISCTSSERVVMMTRETRRTCKHIHTQGTCAFPTGCPSCSYQRGKPSVSGFSSRLAKIRCSPQPDGVVRVGGETGTTDLPLGELSDRIGM